jgi:hypothetical protein
MNNKKYKRQKISFSEYMFLNTRNRARKKTIKISVNAKSVFQYRFFVLLISFTLNLKWTTEHSEVYILF